MLCAIFDGGHKFILDLAIPWYKEGVDHPGEFAKSANQIAHINHIRHHLLRGQTYVFQRLISSAK